MKATNTNPATRFSSRVENYVKYRPTYPPDIIDLLESECGLTRDSIVADIGSGTGILSEMFLKNGNRVFGVEPNREMREAGERMLRAYTNFKSLDASAEATTLGDRAVDFVTAGQAFHWFNSEQTRGEFSRILKPFGWAVLIWNERRIDSTPFLAAYERLLRTRGTDYEQVSSKYVDDETVIAPFFAPHKVHVKTFENYQEFDFESLKGRLLSSSYTPEPGHTNYAPMLEELADIFEAHEQGGRVRFDYDTKVYYGHMTGD
ncbi:MAG TPA: class I SAM-dependent methyltransferase [Pyrinomonadaceae bacterium]|nr:class I SAM-dependent methyltransferase [Pyrinomonadaceae bacterium]